ncbi:hypothetical protein EF912_20310 [Streptomyces sp. WAC07061]|nr:hypothetical protein EF912_20310 [Streptomyces sp. WAC07061]
MARHRLSDTEGRGYSPAWRASPTLGYAHICVTDTVYTHVHLRLQRDAIDTLSTALEKPGDNRITFIR